MAQTAYRPFVPEDTKMREFTLRAVLLGLVLTVVLGAANAYLGLYIDSEGPSGIIKDLPADETAYFKYLPMVYQRST